MRKEKQNKMMHNISYCLNMDTADVSLDQ